MMTGRVNLRHGIPGLRRMMQRFWPYIRSYGGLAAFGIVMLLVEVAMRLLEPWPLKLVFDVVLADALPGESIGATLSALPPATLLAYCALALVAILGLRALSAYASTIVFTLIGSRVLTEVRRDVYRHLQRLSVSFHARARSGDLIVRLIGDVGLLKEVAVTAALPLLGNLLILAGMIAVMFWMHWQLALLMLLVLPLFWLSTVAFGERLRTVSRKQRQREGALAATAAESIGAIRTVQALSLERQFEGAFGDQNRKELKDGVKARRLAAGLERTVDVLIAVATAFVLWYGARLVLRAELTPGDLLVFLFYLKSAFRPMRDLAKYTGRIARASAAAERVLHLLDETPEIYDRPDARHAPSFRGAIGFEDVYFSYEAGRPVLRGIELQIGAGERVALLGTSGTGKSTVAGLILRLYDASWGRVTIDGVDLREYTLASLRAQISIVLQEPLLFAATVRENIACGALEVAEDDIRAAARLANAHEFIEAMPQGYDTVLGERGVTLSVGQRQRIAIARAAVRKSTIVILDEPTAALDEGNEHAVIEALERLTQGRTTLLITHDLQQAARADRILHLHDGRLIEQGSHSQLLEAGGPYAALYRQSVLNSAHDPRRMHAVAS